MIGKLVEESLMADVNDSAQNTKTYRVIEALTTKMKTGICRTNIIVAIFTNIAAIS